MTKELSKPEPGALVAPLRQEPTVLEIIREVARDPQVDVAKLERLLDLQLRIQAKDAELAFNQAFARLQKKLPRIRKDGKVELGAGKGSYSFAQWRNIDEIIRPFLDEEGFTLSFRSRAVPGAVVMVGVLAHSAGHSITSEMQLPPDPGPGRNELKAMGSSQSYGKRYVTIAMLNLITYDDDGTASGWLTDQQVDSILDLMAECGMDKNLERQSKFLQYMHAKTVNEIQQKDYRKAITAMESEKRRVAK